MFHLAPYFFVRHELAFVQGGEPSIYLSPVPFIVLQIARNQVLDDLTRSFPRLRGDTMKFGFEFGCE